MAGTEIMTRFGMALGPAAIYERGFHPTSACGPTGCAVMAAKLMGLNEAKTAEAIGIAAPLGAGSSIWAGSWTPTGWWYQVGRAAQSGVHAAMMADLGCDGVVPVFEDPRGVLRGYSGHINTVPLTAGLGTLFNIEQIIMYRLWFGPYLLTSIESLLALMDEQDLTASDIESVVTRLPTPVMPLVGYPEYPENGLAALTALRYGLAVTSVLREEAYFSVKTSTPDCIEDPQVKALYKRMHVAADPELDPLFPEKIPAVLRLTTKNGQEFEVRNTGPVKGDFENPLSDEELRLKFLSMTDPILPNQQADRLLEALQDIENVDDVSDTFELMGIIRS